MIVHVRNISLEKLALSLLYAALITFPFQIFRSKVMSISIDRLLILISLFLVFVYFSFQPKRKIRYEIIPVFFVLIVPIIHSLFPFNVPSEYLLRLLPVFIIDLIYFITILIAILVFRAIWLIKSYFYVSIILIAFSAYSTLHIVVEGLPPMDIPFREYFPFELGSSEHLEKANRFSLGDFFRFTLPFSRPQDLGFLSSIAIVINSYLKLESQRKLIFTVVNAMLFAIVLLTGSRSALFAFIASYLIIYFLTLSSTKIISIPNSIKFGYLFTFGLGVPLLLIISTSVDFTPFFATFDRLINANTSTSHHLDIRIKTLSYFLNSSPAKILWGHGIGSFPYLFNVSSAHMTYGTMLIEKGLIGFISYSSIFLFSFYLIIRYSLQKVVEDPLLMMCIQILVLLLFANLFYEIFYTRYHWIALAFSFSIILHRVTSKNQ